jgi:PadR family transcriptional regulator PadR
MSIEKWKSQLRKGTTEFAVLLILENKELYGLEILNVITNYEGLAIAEGTIYPLLHRLRREGKVEARWVDDGPTSHMRKYYSLTTHGRQILGQMKTIWDEFQRNLNALGEGEFSND